MPAIPDELPLIVLTWWMVSLSGVLMPGPVAAMAISEGLRRGPIAGPLITAGHALAEFALVGAFAVGLSQALRLPVIIAVIGVLGGLVLGWMGWGIARTARSVSFVVATTAPAARTQASLVRAGLLTTIGNPYWLLWWATVGAAYYVAFSRFGVAALIGLFLIGHLALDLGWNSFLAVVVGAGRRRISMGVYRLILGACGIFVMALSIYFFISGIRIGIQTLR